MESTKLTLNVKTKSLPLVKKYAKTHQTSVSKLVQELFDRIVEKVQKEEEEDPLLVKIKNTEMPDWIKNLSIGTKVDLPEDFDYKEAKYEYLKEKYGL